MYRGSDNVVCLHFVYCMIIRIYGIRVKSSFEETAVFQGSPFTIKCSMEIPISSLDQNITHEIRLSRGLMPASRSQPMAQLQFIPDDVFMAPRTYLNEGWAYTFNSRKGTFVIEAERSATECNDTAEYFCTRFYMQNEQKHQDVSIVSLEVKALPHVLVMSKSAYRRKTTSGKIWRLYTIACRVEGPPEVNVSWHRACVNDRTDDHLRFLSMPPHQLPKHLDVSAVEEEHVLMKRDICVKKTRFSIDNELVVSRCNVTCCAYASIRRSKTSHSDSAKNCMSKMINIGDYEIDFNDLFTARYIGLVFIFAFIFITCVVLLSCGFLLDTKTVREKRAKFHTWLRKRHQIELKRARALRAAARKRTFGGNIRAFEARPFGTPV